MSLDLFMLASFKIFAPIVLVLISFRSVKRFNTKTTFFLAISYILVGWIAFAWIYPRYNPYNILHNGYSLFSLIVMTLIFFLITNISLPQTVFYTFIIKNYIDDLVTFATIISNKPIIAIGTSDGRMIMISCYVLIAITFPLVCFFMSKMFLPTVSATSGLRFWHYLWCVPTSFYIVYRTGIYREFLEIPWVGDQGMSFLPFIWVAGTYLTYFIIIRMLQETSMNALLREKLHMSEMMSALQSDQYTSTQKNIEETRRARHDMRHHLLVLKGYLENQDYNEIEKYLEKYLKTLSPENRMPVCENGMVDVIVRHYAAIASKNGIDFSTSLLIPAKLPIPEIDISVVFGNLLENATEACMNQISGERFIHVNAEIMGANMMAVVIKNSFNGEIHCKNNLFLSTKHDGVGLGIRSVHSIAEKHRGTSTFQYEKEVFQASVLFNPQIESEQKHVKLKVL